MGTVTNMVIVIISKDQPKYINDFENKLSDYKHLYVLDRPTVEYPKNIPCIINNNGTGFLAGRMRDLGAMNFIGEDILFLDGDKVPIGNLKSVENAPFECVLLGVKDDRRKYFDGTTHQITLPDIINQGNGCYTCGILYRASLIEKFRQYNEGRIFHPIFDETWGEEDTWNGDIMNYEHTKIGVVSDCYLSETIGGWTDPKLPQLVTNFVKRLKLRKKYHFIAL